MAGIRDLSRRLARLVPAVRNALAEPRPGPPPAVEGIGPGRSPAWDEATVAGGDLGASLSAMAGLARVLDGVLDALGVPFDDAAVERMLTDPAVSASIAVLALGLAEHPGALEPVASLPPGYRPGSDPGLEARAELAEAVLEFDRRALERLETPIEDVLLQMGEYPAWGAMAAEIVFQVDEAVPLGVGLGLTLESIRPLARPAWKFVVDAHGRVAGLYCRTDAGPSGWEVLPAAKFCWMAWRPRPGDPRGRSILRPVRGPWAMKAGHAPDLSAFLRRFGQPVIKGRTGKTSLGGSESPASRAVLGQLGQPEAAARPRNTPQERLFAQLVRWQAGNVLVLKDDEDAELVEPRGHAASLLGSFDWLDRQIILAILLNPRGLLESQHNSRADSQTAQDMIDKIVRVMRRQAARMVGWQVLWRLNAINFGRAVADAATPNFSLGGADQPDLAAEGGMWAGAGWQAAPEHLPVIDARLGLPPRASRWMAPAGSAAS